jgi:uncharacterized protein involved in exopolysaccharide biosynthesis
MADVTEHPGLPVLSDYARFLRRHRAVLALFSCLGLLAGLVWSMGQQASYSATASLALTPVPKYLAPLSTQIAPPEVTIDTDAQLLHSPAVLGAVGEALGTDRDTAAARLSVVATANSHVLHVSVRASDPELAADAANAAVTAMVEVRRQTLGALQRSQLEQLGLVLAAQQHALAEEQARQVVIPAADDLFTGLLELQTAVDELGEAREAPADVVDPAEPPRRADYPNNEVPIVSGAMLGLLCGWVVSTARDRGRLGVRALAATDALTHPFDVRPGVVTRHEDYHHAV